MVASGPLGGLSYRTGVRPRQSHQREQSAVMNIFKKSGKVVNTAVDVVTDTVDELTTVDSPLVHLPHVTGEHGAALGDDFNIVLLVKEHGARRRLMLNRRREQLLKELDAVDTELRQIEVLIDAAETL